MKKIEGTGLLSALLIVAVMIAVAVVLVSSMKLEYADETKYEIASDANTTEAAELIDAAE